MVELLVSGCDGGGDPLEVYTVPGFGFPQEPLLQNHLDCPFPRASFSDKYERYPENAIELSYIVSNSSECSIP